MTILCGTDFSSGAQRALTAAAHLARSRRTSVHLVHVLDIPGAEEVLSARADARVTAFFEGERSRLEGLLRAEAERLKPIGAQIDVEVLAGRADEAIVSKAARIHAEIVVVAAVGRRGEKLWSLGSTADRIAQTSHSPVLVVRDEGPFVAWGAGERPLRVLVGVDVTPTSDAALRWVGALLPCGPCTVHAVHVYWPPEMRAKLQRRGLTLDAGDPEVERELEKDLKTRTASILLDVPIPLRIVGGLGRPADHLSQIAAEEKSDLVVVGTHQRTGVNRVWHGSVSHDAIVRAATNVAVVPIRG